MAVTPGDWLIPAGVTTHHMNKWTAHAKERLKEACRYLKGNRLAIQAGGNLGIWPVMLVEDFDFSRVITVEPDPDNYECLCRNVRFYPNHIFAVSWALGDGFKPSKVPWEKDPKGRPGWHRVATNGAKGASAMVGMVTVDSISKHLVDRPVDLLALDIEGMELPALKGAAGVIHRDHPVIIVEDLARSKHKNYRRRASAYGTPPGELQAWLREHGYQCVAEFKNDEVWTHDH